MRVGILVKLAAVVIVKVKPWSVAVRRARNHFSLIIKENDELWENRRGMRVHWSVDAKQNIAHGDGFDNQLVFQSEPILAAVPADEAGPLTLHLVRLVQINDLGTQCLEHLCGFRFEFNWGAFDFTIQRQLVNGDEALMDRDRILCPK